jgi:hypothetical protein
MVLPQNFASLTIQQQLLVVSDLERTARGLTPILGLATRYDTDAQQAAQADEDPDPSSFNGDAWGSNWEGGYGSTLEADFGWMYDDGPGSDNVDCLTPGSSGCWGHRDNILGAWDAPLVMGAGYTSDGVLGASMTELFVGGDNEAKPGQADAPQQPPGYPANGIYGSSGSSSSGSGSSSSGSHASSTLPQAALRIGRLYLIKGRLVFTVTLTHGRGSVRVTASRGRRLVHLSVARHGSRFAVSGKLARAVWKLSVVLVPGSGWRGRTYAFSVRI